MVFLLDGSWNMLQNYKEFSFFSKKINFKFNYAVDIYECLKHLKLPDSLHTITSCSKFPSYIKTKIC